MKGQRGRALLAITVALAAAGVAVILTQSPASRLSSDFTINYSAGALVRHGALAAPYDQHALGEMMRRVAPDGAIDPRLPFSLPLAAALPYAALSLLPLEVAFRLSQVLSAALVLVALLLLQRALPIGAGKLTVRPLAIIGVLAAVPAWGTLTEGQPTAWLFLGAALVVLVALGADGWGLATVAGMLLAVKPQYLPAYLIILFAARRWRSLWAAAAGGTAVLLSPLAGGVGALGAMVHNALSANQAVAISLNESWIGLIGPSLSPRVATMVAVALYLAALAALGLLAWRRAGSIIGVAVLAGTLAVLSSPHSLPHDLLILAVPAWLAIVLYLRGELPNPVPALLALDLALLIDLRGIALPLGPLVMTAALGWYAWQFRQRAARQHRPPIGRAA